MTKETVEIKARSFSLVLFSAEVSTDISENLRLRAAIEIAVKARVDLSGADLSGADLSVADLSGADLSGADLSGANLSGADLSVAYLSGADLSGADLSVADLSGANLSVANLSGADLSRADLSGADLSVAYLSGAYLSGAYLSGAYLSGAYLSGAYLSGNEKLSGERPVIQLGPIGSKSRYFVAYLTDQGLRLRTGCFFGTRDEFIEKLRDTHGDNKHAAEYQAALSMIDAHAEIWTPKQEIEQ